MQDSIVDLDALDFSFFALQPLPILFLGPLDLVVSSAKVHSGPLHAKLWTLFSESVFNCDVAPMLVPLIAMTCDTSRALTWFIHASV